MIEERSWVIYGLYRPDRPIFYVGRTFDMARRLKEHRGFFKGKIYAKVLEAGTNNNHGEAENWWIEYYRKLGHIIANKTEGGNGAQRLSDETKRKMSAKTTGRKHTPETIAKMSAAQKGKPKNWTSEGAVKVSETQFKPGHNMWNTLTDDKKQDLSRKQTEWLNSQTHEERSERSKSVWSSYTPEQRAERINRLRYGRWGNKSKDDAQKTMAHARTFNTTDGRKRTGVSVRNWWASLSKEDKELFIKRRSISIAEGRIRNKLAKQTTASEDVPK